MFLYIASVSSLDYRAFRHNETADGGIDTANPPPQNLSIPWEQVWIWPLRPCEVCQKVF